MSSSEHKEIFIPPVQKDYSQLLLFKFIIEEINDNKKRAFISIEREVEIIHLGEYNQHEIYQVFLQNTEINFERKTVSDRELLIKLSYIFDELVITAHPDGTIMKVNNLPFLKHRWKNKRIELVQEYFTEEYLPYFTRIDEILNDEESIVKYLSLPGLYGLYFNGHRRSYKLGEALSQLVGYGEELDSINVEEKVLLERARTNDNEVHKLSIIPSKEIEGVKITGECIYLNGTLDFYKKEADLGMKKILYIAKWHGLKTFYK